MSLARRQVVAAIPAAALGSRLAAKSGARPGGRKVVTFLFGQAESDGQAALRNDLVERSTIAGQISAAARGEGAAVNNL